MTRPVRDWNVDQSMLLPLSVHDFLPADHVAHSIRDTVAEELDLSAVWAAYGGDRGQPPYHPAMMTALLLYAYCQGIYASRRIAAACEQRVDFMAVTGMERPDFRTISDFRKQHLQALEEPPDADHSVPGYARVPPRCSGSLTPPPPAHRAAA